MSEVTVQVALAQIKDLFDATQATDKPFEFNTFPILIPVSEIFKKRGDTGRPYISMEYINKQLAAIRRDGNWPKELLREENLDLRIASFLLDAQDFDQDLGIYGDTYFYMEGPVEAGELVPLLSELYSGRPGKWWELVCIENKDGQIGGRAWPTAKVE